MPVARHEPGPEHVYNRIRAHISDLSPSLANATFEDVQRASEAAKEDGICIQTYGDPRAQARMLILCNYVKVA